MLDISDLTVSVQENDTKKIVIKQLSLHVDDGELHVIFGPNGSGKTTLFHAILGYPGFMIESGKIMLDGIDMTSLRINERIHHGLGMLFQNPPTIRGVTLNDIASFIADKKGYLDPGNVIAKLAEQLKLESFLSRDLNRDFSGGEKKRAELFQVLLQDPTFLLLDELDSGVDVENIEIMCKVLNEFFFPASDNTTLHKKSGLIITHSGYLIKKIETCKAHVLINGEISCSGSANQLYDAIVENGFINCVRECNHECDSRCLVMKKISED